MKQTITDKKPTDKSPSEKKMKSETSVEKKKRKIAEDYKKRYFDFYDDVKISDRQDW